MNILLIFDIDGTLIDSMNIDSECYKKAIFKEFSIDNINDDWSVYKNATDSGIFEEIYKNHFKKNPKHNDFRIHEKRFFTILKQKLKNINILEIPGAKNIISKLKMLPNYFIGIATGTYKKTALLKLNQIGIYEKNFPLSTANNDKKRDNIIKNCIKKSKQFYKIDRFDKIISIGDGIWDLTTAVELSLPFIGIGTNKFSQCISINDYLNYKKFIDAVNKAFIPNYYENINII